MSDMEFKQPELDHLEVNYSRDAVGYNREILIAWRNKNSGKSDIRLVINFI